MYPVKQEKPKSAFEEMFPELSEEPAAPESTLSVAPDSTSMDRALDYLQSREDPVDFGKHLKQVGSSFTRALGSTFTDTIAGIGRLAEESGFLGPISGPTAKWTGTQIRKFGESLTEYLYDKVPDDPELRDRLYSQIASGFGSAAGFLLSSAASGGAKFASIVPGMMVSAEQRYQTARQRGASEEEAFKSYLLGLPIGATEALPFGRLIDRLKLVRGGSKVIGTLTLAAHQGAEEAGQEFLQTVADNAADIYLFDDTKFSLENLGKGSLQAALVGGIVGFTTGGVLGAATNHIREEAERAKTEPTEGPVPPQEPTQQPIEPSVPEVETEPAPSPSTEPSPTYTPVEGPDASTVDSILSSAIAGEDIDGVEAAQYNLEQAEIIAKAHGIDSEPIYQALASAEQAAVDTFEATRPTVVDDSKQVTSIEAFRRARTGDTFEGVLYRGSGGTMQGTTGAKATLGQGVYVTPNLGYAETFASDEEGNVVGKVEKVRVTLENPLVIENDADLEKFAKSADLTVEDLVEGGWERTMENTIYESGHDGVIVKFGKGDTANLQRVFGGDQVYVNEEAHQRAIDKRYLGRSFQERLLEIGIPRDGLAMRALMEADVEVDEKLSAEEAAKEKELIDSAVAAGRVHPELARLAKAAIDKVTTEEAPLRSAPKQSQRPDTDPTNILDQPTLFYREVTNPGDIDDAVRMGLETDTKVGMTSNAQAFNARGEAVMIFRGGDAYLKPTDEVSYEATVTGRPKPIGIILRTDDPSVVSRYQGFGLPIYTLLSAEGKPSGLRMVFDPLAGTLPHARPAPGSFVDTSNIQGTDPNTAQDVAQRSDAVADKLNAITKHEFGINGAALQVLKDQYGWDSLPEEDRIILTEVVAEAVESGAINDAEAIAGEIRNSSRPASARELAAMHLRFAAVDASHSEAIRTLKQLKQNGADASEIDVQNAIVSALEDQAFFIAGALNLARGRAGQALGFFRIGLDMKMFSQTGMQERAEANKGLPLTTEEREQIAEMVGMRAELQKKVSKLQEEEDAEREARIEKAVQEAIAAAAAEEERKGRPARTDKSDEMKKEFDSIIRDLEKLAIKVQGRTSALLDPRYTAQQLYHLGRLAFWYVKAGARTFQEVFVKVNEAIADNPGGPSDVTERELRIAMNQANPNRKPRVEAEHRKAWSRLQTEARLLNEIEELEAGVIADQGKPRAAVAQRIKDLRKKVADLKKELLGDQIDQEKLQKVYKKIHEYEAALGAMGQDVDLGKLPSNLDDAKNLRRDLYELLKAQEKIKAAREKFEEFRLKREQDPTWEPTPEEEPSTRRRLSGLEKARLELRQLEAQMNKMIHDMKPYTYGDFRARNMDPYEAFKATVKAQYLDWLTISRPLLATGDHSGILRQGFALLARSTFDPKRAKIFGNAIVEAERAFWKGGADRAFSIHAQILNHPNYLTWKKYGLFVSPLDASLSGGEEIFNNRLLERYSFLRWVTAPSERHMVTFLNLMRTGIFNEFYENNKGRYAGDEAGLTKAMTAFADYVNKASGRGKLQGTTARSMSKYFFAPRFMVSRIQTPLALFKYWSIPTVRAEIAKDFAGMVVDWAVVLSLASLAGATVGADPRDSDWGKIVIGNTRIDPYAGLQQPMRIFAALLWGGLDRAGITGKHLPENMKGFNNILSPYDLFTGFLTYKLSPPIHIIAELIGGETVVGEETTLLPRIGRGLSEVELGTLGSNLVPLILQDGLQAYKIMGFQGAAMSTPMAFFGVGTNTYGDALKRGDVKQMLGSAGFRPRRPTYPAWVSEGKREDLDEVFADTFYRKMLQHENRLESLPKGPRRKKYLEALAAQSRYETLLRIGYRQEKYPDYSPYPEALQEPLLPE